MAQAKDHFEQKHSDAQFGQKTRNRVGQGWSESIRRKVLSLGFTRMEHFLQRGVLEDEGDKSIYS